MATVPAHRIKQYGVEFYQASFPAREIDRLHAKVEAGAMWAQTQPVYDLDQLEAFLARLGRVPVPLVVGILPLHSFRHAEFLHNEVPGIVVPEHVQARLTTRSASGSRPPRPSSPTCAAGTPAPI